jgi:rsbT co-antagonist protein RsbR
MVDRSRESSAEQALIRQMALTEQSIERRRKVVGLGADDVQRLTGLRDLMQRHADAFTSAFFEHLGALEEGRALVGSREVSERVRQLKREHLLAMTHGQYGLEYVEQRVKLGVFYSRVGLEQRAFLGAFHQLLRAIGGTIMKERGPEGFESFMSLEKIAFFDIGLITDVLVFERERTIRQQQEAIRELSTPVLQVRDRMLLLPIIGVIDTARARLITESLLRAIRGSRARVVVVDVTGVATIDSRVANHLLKTVAAARLMGARVIVSGLSSDVAQSLVALGIDLDRLNTVGDLQGGIEEAERFVGYRVTLDAPAADRVE